MIPNAAKAIVQKLKICKFFDFDFPILKILLNIIIYPFIFPFQLKIANFYLETGHSKNDNMFFFEKYSLYNSSVT